MNEEVSSVKATGYVKRVDHLGRVTLPKKIRRSLGSPNRFPVEIFVDGETIILQKYRQKCIFCGTEDHVEAFKGKRVCEACLADLAQLGRTG
jgi:transcriptional pleiotropic regulator of transition state genes